MISFFSGGMIGRIGNIVWCCGSDQHPDRHYNAWQTGGHDRFGACYLLSPEYANAFCRVLTPQGPEQAVATPEEVEVLATIEEALGVQVVPLTEERANELAVLVEGVKFDKSSVRPARLEGDDD